MSMLKLMTCSDRSSQTTVSTSQHCMPRQTKDQHADLRPRAAYTDTTIILDQADASWATRGGNPFYVNETGSISSSSAQPSTPDGGVTWHIPWITLHESDFSKNLPE